MEDRYEQQNGIASSSNQNSFVLTQPMDGSPIVVSKPISSYGPESSIDSASLKDITKVIFILFIYFLSNKILKTKSIFF